MEWAHLGASTSTLTDSEASISVEGDEMDLLFERQPVMVGSTETDHSENPGMSCPCNAALIKSSHAATSLHLPLALPIKPVRMQASKREPM